MHVVMFLCFRVIRVRLPIGLLLAHTHTQAICSRAQSCFVHIQKLP